MSQPSQSSASSVPLSSRSPVPGRLGGKEGVDYLDSWDGRRIYLSKEEAVILSRLWSQYGRAVLVGAVLVAGTVLLGGWVMACLLGARLADVRAVFMAAVGTGTTLGLGMNALVTGWKDRTRGVYLAERERLGTIYASAAVEVPRKQWS